MKKFLSIVLTIAMILSMVSVVAFADGEISGWADNADTAWYNDTDTEFKISTAAELAGLAKLVNEGTDSFAKKTVNLTASIDLEQIDWTAIGTSTNPFLGTFDGGNNVISNLWGAEGENGLFGYTSSGNRAENYGSEAIIRNFIIDGAVINDAEEIHNGAGAVVGCGNMYTTIKNVTVKGEILISGCRAGGILGYAYSGALIDNCHIIATNGSEINALFWAAGGIMGFGGPDGSVYITNCSVKNVSVNAVNNYGAAGILGNGGSGKVENVTVENVEITAAYAPEYNAYISGGPVVSGNNYVTGTELTVDGTKVEMTETEIENVIIPVAEVNGTYYENLQAAIFDAAAIATAEAPVTVELKKGVYEVGNIQFPAHTSYITIKGAQNNDVALMSAADSKATVLKNSSLSSASGSDIAYSNITIDNIEFDSSNILFTAGRAKSLYANWTITNCYFHDIDDATAVHFQVSDSPMNGFTFTNNVIENVTGSAKSGVVLNASKGDVTFSGNTINNVNWNAIQCINAAADANIVITDNILSSGADEGVLNLSGVNAVELNNNTITTTGEQPEIAYFVPAVKIGNVYYKSFEAAVKAAEDGAVIDLLGDVHKLDNTNKIISGKEVTIQNGTFDISNTRWAGNSVFDVSGNSTVLNMNNVKFVGSNYSSAYGVIYVYNGATVNLTNVEFDLENELAAGGAVLKGNGEQNSTFNITNSKFNLLNPVSVIKNTTLTMTDSSIRAITDENGIVNNAFREIEGSITDSEIYIEGFENGFKNTSDEELTIDGDSVVTVYNCSKGSPSEGKLGYDIDMTGTSVLTVADDAKLYADTVNTGSNIEAPEGAFVSKANKIYLQFDYNEASKEGEQEYDIVLVGANSEDINRLNTADFTFDFDYEGTNGSKMAYEIKPAEKITLTENADFENRYMFNFKGKDNVEDTANKIVIGKVKFTGYGEFSFKVDTTVTYKDANIVTATTLVDNVVDVFAIGGATGYELIVNENDVVTDMVGKIEGAEIIVPTRKLTINVDFPNAVEKNDALYQMMTVTVTGDDIETLTYNLGNEMTADGKYVIEIVDELTLNNAYTVEVSGEGYRTARYTVTMTEEKELNFWNNVKDVAIEVEEGKSSSAKNVTFLAGDIVKDSNINIYDLSAVVSYFGTIDLKNNGEAEKYIRYDLNRDGKIDSKDVAYVLVSWGK